MPEPHPITAHAPRMLVAASGSAASRRATAIAAELASTFDAELTIVHVIPANEYRTTRLGPILPINRRLEDPLTSEVLLDARRIAWTRGVSPRTVLIAGEPARAIVALAEDLDADLLLIGSQRRLTPAALAAKTRTRVHANAPCPVLPVAVDRPRAPRAASKPLPIT